MNKTLSYVAGAAVAALLMWPVGSTAMAAGAAQAANLPVAATSTLIQSVRDDDDDRGRGRGDRDRGDRDYDRDRDRGDRFDRHDRGRWGGGWRYRCRAIRHLCADRHGWGGWRFRGCMIRRGCY